MMRLVQWLGLKVHVFKELFANLLAKKWISLNGQKTTFCPRLPMASDNWSRATTARLEPSAVIKTCSIRAGFKAQIPQENFHVGDRVKVYVTDVVLTPKGTRVFISRTAPDMQKLHLLLHE